jgi:hypothetical protein
MRDDKWAIVAVQCTGPIGYKWRWVKAMHAGKIERSRQDFDYYYECVVDAQEHGFRPPKPENRAEHYKLA